MLPTSPAFATPYPAAVLCTTLYLFPFEHNEMYSLHINFHIVSTQPALARKPLPMTKTSVTYFNLRPRAMHLYQTV
jgi:hypothetical protein